MKKLLVILAFGILGSTRVFSAGSDVNLGWDAAKSMTPALEHTINVAHVDPQKELIGKSGPSPSNQALVVVLTQEGPYVLMCKDYDLRTLPGGQLRPTYGALKASFGFGLPKDHAFQNSFEALVRGPANTALYRLFDTMDLKNVKTANFVYSEGGQGWGPAVTIPLFLTGNNAIKMEFEEAEKILAALNHNAHEVFAAKSESDTLAGRFRDFSLIPLKSLLKTGSDQPAVLDESLLETIEVDGQLVKLWDESQMRKNLLPHVGAFTSQFYDK